MASASDFNAGLIGAIIVSSADVQVDAVGKPTDIDREFIQLYAIFDENESHLLSDNVAAYAPAADTADAGFIRSNRMHRSARVRVCEYERVRLCLRGVGLCGPKRK